MSSQNTEEELLEQERVREEMRVERDALDESERRRADKRRVSISAPRDTNKAVDSSRNPATGDGDLIMFESPPEPVTVQRRRSKGKKRLSESPDKGSSERRASTRRARASTSDGPPAFAPMTLTNTAASGLARRRSPTGDDVLLLKDGAAVEPSSILSASDVVRVVDSVKSLIEQAMEKDEKAAMEWLAGGMAADMCFRTVCFTNKAITRWSRGVGDLGDEDLTQACKTCPSKGSGGGNRKVAANPCLVMWRGAGMAREALVLLPDQKGSFTYWL